MYMLLDIPILLSMGRPPSAARKHFVKVSGPMANKTHYFVRCRHCLHAHEMRSKACSLQTPSRREPDSPMPEKIIGRVKNFTRHLQRYHGIVEEEPQPQPQQQQQQHPSGLLQLPQETLTESRGNERSGSRFTFDGDKLESRGPVISSPHHQRQLERLLLQFQVSLALPDTFVEHPATLRLFEFLNPACLGLLPSRRVLGGRILDACAKEYQEQSAAALRKVQDTTGGRINFLISLKHICWVFI
ncbi:hypothetical protein DVH05_008397 [Phytophthora capsici]|nr:hypothetical protein DVH05_008397 [Phytophthora capsici]